MAYLGSKYGLYADPSFQMGMALGNAYGTMWANNAKRRQEKKLDDYINDMEEGVNDIESMVAETRPTQNRLEQEAHQALTGGQTENNPLKRKSNMDRAIEAVGDYGIGGVNYIKKMDAMSPLERAKYRYRNLSVDDVTDWARSQGINQEVIDSRMPSLQKKLATNVGSLMANEISNNIYSGDTNKIIQGIQQLDELAKYDPASAERLRRVGDSARLQALNHERQLELANARSRQTGSGLRISDTANRNATDLIIQLLDKQSSGVELTPEEKQMLQNAQHINNAYNAQFGIGINSGQREGGITPQKIENDEAVDKEIDFRVTKAMNDYGTALAGVYETMARMNHDVRTFEVFKERAGDVIAKMKADGMTDEGINNFLAKVFKEIDEQTHPPQYRNPDGGRKFADATMGKGQFSNIAHKYD